MTPAVPDPTVEARIAVVLGEHTLVWENDGGDYGGRSWFECSCDAGGSGIFATEYATEADHRAHQARILAEHTERAVREARARELRDAAAAMDPSGNTGYGPGWLTARAKRIEEADHECDT